MRISFTLDLRDGADKTADVSPLSNAYWQTVQAMGHISLDQNAFGLRRSFQLVASAAGKTLAVPRHCLTTGTQPSGCYLINNMRNSASVKSP